MNARHAFVLLAGIALVACGGRGGTADPSPPADAAGGPTAVYVVNYPLGYFAERLGADSVEVTFPAPPDVDPAFWAPDADRVAAYQSADLILLNGAGYAGWVGRATLPGARTVDTSAGLADRFITIEQGPSHSHGPDGEHSHGETAFTTWLDLTLAAEQAKAVAAAIIDLQPGREPEILARLATLEAELDQLDGRLVGAAESLAGAPLLFSHPVYQYLIRRYELNGRELHWEPDTIPGSSDLRDLDRILASHPAAWMLWEAEPLPETVSMLAERGVGSLVFAPCGNVPDGGDLMDVMRANAVALESAARTR